MKHVLILGLFYFNLKPAFETPVLVQDHKYLIRTKNSMTMVN